MVWEVVFDELPVWVTLPLHEPETDRPHDSKRAEILFNDEFAELS